jgi:hypothetical protein
MYLFDDVTARTMEILMKKMIYHETNKRHNIMKLISGSMSKHGSIYMMGYCVYVLTVNSQLPDKHPVLHNIPDPCRQSIQRFPVRYTHSHHHNSYVESEHNMMYYFNRGTCYPSLSNTH